MSATIAHKNAKSKAILQKIAGFDWQFSAIFELRRIHGTCGLRCHHGGSDAGTPPSEMLKLEGCGKRYLDIPFDMTGNRRNTFQTLSPAKGVATGKGDYPMKFSLLVLTSLMSAALVLGSDGATSATYVSHEKVAAALAGGGGLATGPDYIVIGLHRSASGAAELHEKQTDVYYVVDGEATFVTGGKLIGNKLVSPGQRQGTGIEGGEVHHLTKGDVIVIPAGVPHWFKDVPHSISYLLVKVVKP